MSHEMDRSHPKSQPIDSTLRCRGLGGLHHAYGLEQKTGERRYMIFADDRARNVTDIHEGMFYPTRWTLSQGMLLPLTPQESLVVYRTRASRRRALRLTPA